MAETDTSSNVRKSGKSAAAFRTISEVSDQLEIPPHVLRFWETKFSQIRPLKRGGGRRYYRPEDIDLLKRISELLYSDGYTIKGVQRLLRDGVARLKSAAVDRKVLENKYTETSEKEPGPESVGLSKDARNEISQVLEELVELKKKLKDVGL